MNRHVRQMEAARRLAAKLGAVDTRCQGETRSFLGYCDRPSTVERDGKRYCWQHDPERLDAQRHVRWLKRREEIKAEDARREARFRRQDLLHRSGILDLTDRDLIQIVAAGGIRAFLPWQPEETDADAND